MLKPVMQKHFITILLFLLCLLVARPAEARLTLGVVAGPDVAAGEISSAQANSLASLLAEELHEEVVVKELADSATLINWLDRFAMLDLALLSTKEVKAGSGRLLQIGPFGGQGKLSLVAHQGITGDLLQRIATIVSDSGFVPWRTAETIVPPEKRVDEEIPSPVDPEPESEPKLELEIVDEVTAEPVELQQVPPLSPGRTWVSPEERVYRDILPVAQPPAKNLVLGVFPDPKGLVRSSQQAEQLASYLEQVLPVTVKVREFTHAETFTEWFMRYRMVDLAVLSPAAAKANLGNEYLAVAKLLRTDKSGAESVELFVMRHGQNEEMQAPLQGALLNMMQTADGQALLASLGISDVLTIEGVSVQPPVVDQEAEPVLEIEPPVLEVVEEPVEAPVDELLAPTVDYAEPIEPVAPAAVVVKVLPTLPDLAEPTTVVSVPEMPEVAPIFPELTTIPVEPVQPELVEAVKVPDLMLPQVVPLQPEVPPLPNVVVPEPVEPLVAPVVPVAPDAQPVEIPSILLPEEPVVVEPAIVPEVAIPDLATQAEPEQPETIAVVEAIVPEELETPVVIPTEPEIESELVISEDPLDFEQQEDNDQQKMLTDLLKFAEPVSAHEQTEVDPVVSDENVEAWTDEEFAAVLGEDLVASVVAQPDIPRELRPSGVPIVRPGRIAQRTTAAEDELLIASIPEPLRNVELPGLPDLLPEPEPEPGVIYVVPFVAVMVPAEVNARVFDQFVDTLNREGEVLGVQFVILKEGLERVPPHWLSVRKYVTGEIYAYVEDSGCCSTDLRTKARLTYRRPSQKVPTFGFEYPVKRFFDHDRSTLDVERVKLADDIAGTLANELLKVLKN